MYRWDTREDFHEKTETLGSGAWTPCETSVLWEFEDSARQGCGWCSERCPCPGQEDWIRWSLKVSVDQLSLFSGSVMQSCCSLCSCWAKGWPGNQRILSVCFWDLFNFCFNSMMSWKNLNSTKESFIGRLKPLVFWAWAHMWNANPELNMPEFGVKSKDREFQWCYLSCDEDLN